MRQLVSVLPFLFRLVAVSAFSSHHPISHRCTTNNCSSERNPSVVAVVQNMSSTEENSSSTNNNTPTPETIKQAKALIQKAISIGAPAYNSGDIQECARVYRCTGVDICSSGLLPPNLRSSLEKTIQTDHDDDDKAEAWAFRSRFDAILEYQIPFMPETASDGGAAAGLTLEKFTDKMLPPMPFLIHDNVMGGISSGQWDASSNTFSGSTSLANNGGFASLRWRMDSVQNWSYARGIYLRVKHSDPQTHTFRIILKDTACESVRGANFKNVFCNPDQGDEPVLIPFEAFDSIEQMGRQLQGPVLNRGGVTEIGLMAIKPSVVGAFELVIEEWGLYFETK